MICETVQFINFYSSVSHPGGPGPTRRPQDDLKLFELKFYIIYSICNVKLWYILSGRTYK